MNIKNFIVVILLFVLAVSINSQYSKILNFEDIINSMKSGKTVKAVIYYGQAKMIVAGEKIKMTNWARTRLAE